MKDSKGVQRPQKTSYEGCPDKVGLETQDRQQACSMPAASDIAKTKVQTDTANLLEKVLHKDNLNKAYKRVKKNKGSHGVDGMKVDELLHFLKQHGEALREEIAIGKYKPKPVTRVEIPKPNGVVRLLGIPTVIDRFIQQAIAQILTKVYDKDFFSENSFGFRPGRDTHMDELDKELEKRGHKFCRYADDCNIYVKSKRAGERVMKSLNKFLEKKLKLTVNKEKSAVDRPWKRKFLGFTFYINKCKARIRPHDKSIERLKNKIREITNRNVSTSMEWRIKRLNLLTVGWVNYFKIADMKGKLREIDEWSRRRLRACLWKQWKKVKTKFINLKKFVFQHIKPGNMPIPERVTGVYLKVQY